MRLALLTDIHANREAFEAVLADLSQRQIDRLVFLGDIVGYGPDPGWCIDQVESLVAKGAIALRGNHDRAIGVSDKILNANARRVIDWTVNCLNARQKLFLSELPLEVQDGDTLFVHASANDPADWLYVNSESTARPSFLVCDARLIFCGHVHRAALYSCDLAGRVTHLDIAPGNPMPLLQSRRWLGVIGSVGQPRDGTTLASYAILDRDLNELTFRRVGYDATTTARKSREAGLPEALAQRLMKGI
ncbi:metallophosphoesterase family protein [Cypionkella sp.]|uniref:metallophosphoesterase family protein n=1 Tax=Cypionkella sp. TaxID=2811411 RepID=UPI002616F769|nr:metallophosphoesterase family protein [Cypionkella sp.]MDB5664772.1 metallophosphoesterase [Cypionkella sp.]